MEPLASDSDKYRSFLDAEEWRFGAPPNYDVVNKLFEEGRTKIWPPGSLEEEVQNLVKTWEMEMFHKVRPEDVKTCDVKNFRISVNDKYRSFLDAEEWRFGAPPNYDVVNKLFEEGRTKIWPPGSLEEEVQNLVKTWEMEMFHKVRPEDVKTCDVKNFRISVNGRKPLSLQEVAKIGGGYNNFLQTSLPEKLRCYDPAEETNDSSQKIFTTTFLRGFAVEILQVYSGPPVIVYKFRHWGFMEGPFKGHAPTGEKAEFIGMAIFEVSQSLFVFGRSGATADLASLGREAETAMVLPVSLESTGRMGGRCNNGPNLAAMPQKIAASWCDATGRKSSGLVAEEEGTLWIFSALLMLLPVDDRAHALMMAVEAASRRRYIYIYTKLIPSDHVLMQLNHESKVVKVEFFYDRGELLAGLIKGGSSEDSTSEMPSGCPFSKTT
ncbi:hypothetical protein RJ640_006749 [Escallonia rubra]|uniref:Pathogen-related protein n=1 Tax=Escallonia rubra TaxID=112253 RepID=A0AA88UL02_9ASTE|nr:hypothetical protein RJ640_006749 [Escallonia rubra]